VGWFQKHLNWTTVIVTIASNVISNYLVSLFLNITHIPFWGTKHPPGTLDVMLPAFSSFAFDMQLLLATILSIIGFIWVLRKKNRRWTYLLFFVAFLVIEIPDFLSYIIKLPEFIDNLVYFYPVGMILWLAGWIILLRLKNKSTQPLDSPL
jgi:hypothetical protein